MTAIVPSAGVGPTKPTIAPAEAGPTISVRPWIAVSRAFARSRAATGTRRGSSARIPAALSGLGPRPWVYFVHSFAPPVGAETVAVCDYGGPVAALVGRGTLWGAQFHPEKSGSAGLRLLSNFVDLAAAA